METEDDVSLLVDQGDALGGVDCSSYSPPVKLPQLYESILNRFSLVIEESLACFIYNVLNGLDGSVLEWKDL